MFPTKSIPWTLLAAFLLSVLASAGCGTMVLEATPTGAATATEGVATVALEATPTGAATVTPGVATVAATTTPSMVAVITPSATDAPLPEGWQRHSAQYLQIDLPGSWEILNVPNPSMGSTVIGGGRNIFIAHAPESLGEITRLLELAQTADAEGTTVEELLDRVKADIEAEGGSVHSINSSLTLGGYEAGSVDYSKTEQTGTIHGIVYVILLPPDEAYFVHFTSSEGDFLTAAPLFEMITDTFRFRSLQ